MSEKYAFSKKYNCYGVYRVWKTDPKTKQKIWAKTYGKKAFFIPVSEVEKSDK